MAKEIGLTSLERTQWIILSVLSLASLALWDWKITLGVILGGVIVILNFKVLRKIVEGGLSGERISKSFFLKYTLKFLCLVAAVAGVALLLRGVINLVAFLVGLLTIFLAILAEGLKGYRHMNADGEKTDGT